MKNQSYILYFSLISFLLVSFAACDSDSNADTTAPVIRLVAPTNEAILLIGDEDGVLFEAEFSDDIQLASYKVDIHHAGDGHGHTRQNDDVLPKFNYQRSFALEGTVQSVSHRNIVIPEGVRPGEYHLVLYCSDTSGNESIIARDIELAEQGHSHDH